MNNQRVQTLDSLRTPDAAFGVSEGASFLQEQLGLVYRRVDCIVHVIRELEGSRNVNEKVSTKRPKPLKPRTLVAS